MTAPTRSTAAAATGALFAVLLTIANGQGGALSAPRDIVATVALTLLIPFAGHVAAVLRAKATNATDIWLAYTAAAAAAVGTSVKLASDAPQIALSHHGIVPGSQTATALAAVADGTTILALFPLALFCTAAGLCALRSRALPTWLGVGAVVSGAALLANGCFRHTENVPALLVMALWCLLTSVHLMRAARREPATSSAISATSTT